MAGEKMSWWRAHHGLPSHPRWLQAARKSGQPVPVAFSVAMWLLDHASRADDRGIVVDFDVGPCAAYLWIDEDDVVAVVDALRAIGWIVDGKLHSWGDRQPKREDATATERKRNQRDRERENHEESLAVTAPAEASRNVTQCHAPEKRREDSSLRSERARADDRPASDFPPQAFEIWYRGWPNKVQRGAAERAFEKVRKSRYATFAQLCEGVRRYVASKPPDRNWQNPATWLNGKGWLDQPAPQGGLALVAPDPSEPRVDFGGGVMWPERSVKAVIDHWRRDPTSWPRDRLGPPPGEPGCKLPAKMMEAA